MSSIALYIPNTQDQVAAKSLAQHLALPDYDASSEIFDFLLCFEHGQWFLRDIRGSDKKERLGDFTLDFTQGEIRHRYLYGGGKGQMLAKAVGLNHKKHLSILDATAGFGGDAFVLASLGCNVKMCEKNSVVYFLLTQALEYAQRKTEQADPLSQVLASMCCVHQNALQFLKTQPVCIDVIYLDPMFPMREKSAKVKKNMQYLHELLSQQQSDDEQLLSLALQQDCARVVVKRPAKASAIAHSQTPSLSLKGKSTRYDIYTLKKLI